MSWLLAIGYVIGVGWHWWAAKKQIARARAECAAQIAELQSEHEKCTKTTFERGLREGGMSMLDALKSAGFVCPNLRVEILTDVDAAKLDAERDAAFLRSLGVKPEGSN